MNTSIIIIQSLSGQNYTLQMSMTVKISLPFCAQSTANRLVVFKANIFGIDTSSELNV